MQLAGWPFNLKELTTSTQKVICAGGQPVPNPLRVVQVAVSSGRFLVEPSGRQVCLSDNGSSSVGLKDVVGFVRTPLFSRDVVQMQNENNETA